MTTVPIEDDRLETAVEAATRAGDLQRERFGTAVDVDRKGRHDLVTEVDVSSEERITDLIADRHPDDAILAEESGASGDADTRWIVDPLDGTTNFAHGVPFFGVSIAVERDGRPIVGVVHLTPSGETYAAVRGEGAYRDGEALSVTDRTDVGESLIASGIGPDALATGDPIGAIGRLAERTRGFRRFGAAAIDLAFVAEGRVDGSYHVDASDWDVAAGSLLVTEAGGRASPLPDGASTADDPFVASNGRIHGALLDLVG